ncbi:MAG: hypothetical protein AAGA56_12490 [Myxococcota bacterium]
MAALTSLLGCDFVLDVTCTPDEPSAAEDSDCVRSNGFGLPRTECDPLRETPTTTPTFDEVAELLLRVGPGQANCADGSACHLQSRGLSADLSMDEATPEALYRFLTTARGSQSTPYVVSGEDSRESWILCNVRGGDTIGSVMPRGSVTGLPPEDYRLLEDWILTGAPGPGP